MTMTFDYGSRRWKALRAAILRRDGYRCRDCRRYGMAVPAVTVHHVRHVEDDPDGWFDPGNLVSLCAACHNRRHPEKGVRGKRYGGSCGYVAR